ncbi:SRPBCC domain-containing protein [Terracoccus luteus]|uniref:Uncharacterized protein YndB with AHSA1/START domain n=1 Tax=Terracoccus luteus TaxID=53356 RepID=A0A839PN04_9MICO|nr:SRPBCC domain-containing protein [Terracoccus luteus]MBB2985610.1 uncharacterized protein YndB with AHSA1/START domain [Terracoccus luteus]MCP2171262.1 uncharacterized protein YndB with AHSA1/START domain [Terracoccus luteus]
MATPLDEMLAAVHRTGGSVTVEIDRLYPTTAPDLWSACTEPDRLARWFARVTGDLRPGGGFTIHFDDDDTPACTLVDCTPPESFVWRWPVGGHDTTVTVEVAADPGGARLRLRHEGLPGGPAAGYAAGWDTYVRRLEADLSHDDAADGDALPGWDATWGALHPLYRAALASA